MANLVCKELVTVPNIYGGYDCKVWEEMPATSQQSFFPNLTMQEVNDLSIACIFCLVSAYCLREIKHAF